MKSRTKDIDLGFHSIVSDLETLGETSVDVGFFDDGTMSADGEMSMVDLASLQLYGRKANWNYGDAPVPARDFMSKTALDHSTRIANEMQDSVARVIDKKDFAVQSTLKVGEKYGEMMKETIDDFDTPPNADWWAEEKGKNDPLVDTSKMRESVKAKLTENF